MVTAALSVKRARALSNVCRSAQRSRRFHSSSVNQATALSSATLSEEVPEITLPPMFDIFDAPTTLAQSSEFIRTKYTSNATSTSSSPAVAKLTSALRRSRPAPLPHPILFDGPARPQNGVLAFQSRLRDAGLRAPSTPSRAPRNTAPTRPFSSSEPSVQIFDGPARITRYHHRRSGNSFGDELNSARYMIALGIAGTVGCATILNECS